MKGAYLSNYLIIKGRRRVLIAVKVGAAGVSSPHPQHPGEQRRGSRVPARSLTRSAEGQRPPLASAEEKGSFLRAARAAVTGRKLRASAATRLS